MIMSNLKNKKMRISDKSEWIWNLLLIGREVRFNESINIVSELRQVGGFLLSLWFPQSIKLTATI
jgi:hypothetical protein